jgi:hypothetical protein
MARQKPHTVLPDGYGGMSEKSHEENGEYVVVKSPTLEDLCQKVNILLKQGCRLYGSQYQDKEGTYIQPMIKVAVPPKMALPRDLARLAAGFTGTSPKSPGA